VFKDVTRDPDEEAKKDRNVHASCWLFARTTYVDIAPELLQVGSCRWSTRCIFQVSWKSVKGSRSCGGRKSPSPIDLAHGLYNSLYYRASCDDIDISWLR